MSQSMNISAAENGSEWIECISCLCGKETICKIPFLLKLQFHKI